jgi:HD superfamily phosphodiesterase
MGASLERRKLEVVRTEPDAVGLRLHRELARSLYASAVRLQARIGADALEGKPWLAEARRLVQRMVDLVEEDATTLVGLTSVKALAPQHSSTVVRTHGVNVAILSIVLGREAALRRADLAEVGLAAFLHDVGLDATGDPNVHALHGAECLLQLGPVETVLRPALVALEHHVQEDALEDASAVERDAVTRIVQIADAYDTLTACCGAVGRPDRVLRFLLQQGAKRFDSALVKLLARALGIYPPSTIVRLDNGDVGVVLRSHRDPAQLDRPLVRVVRDAAGKVRTGVVTVDLAERDTLGYVRRIVESLDPEPLGISPAAVFLGTA